MLLFIGGITALAAHGTKRDARADVAAAPTIAEARALGAHWRAQKTEALARDYAAALISVGLYDHLLTEIGERGLFAGDRDAANLFRAEANLRLGRYNEALKSAAGSAGNPYFAYARARASYALTGDGAAAGSDLATALRGPKELVADAWLFRARLALDANDFEAAEAAARRAVETGADRRRAALVSIERAIRAGAPGEAARLLKAHLRKAGPATAEELRLAAMIKLRAGDPRGASRFLDETRSRGAGDDRARLLSALAKWMTGDLAQAHALVGAHLAAAPHDWMALELGAAIARDFGRAGEADHLLERLAGERPALGIVRTPRREGAALDRAFAELAALGGDEGLGGVAASLLGPDVEIPDAIREANETERGIIKLAIALEEGDERTMRAAARALAGSADPLALALAGKALLKAGDFDCADAAFAASSALAADFFAPVELRAERYAQRREFVAARALLQAFLEANSGHHRARLALATIEAGSGATRAAAANFAAIPPEILFADGEAVLLYAVVAKASGGTALSTMRARAKSGAPSARRLGEALLASGDEAGAAPPLRRALIDEPADGELASLYLEAMTRLDRTAEARSLLAEIVRRRPGATAAAALLEMGGERPEKAGVKG